MSGIFKDAAALLREQVDEAGRRYQGAVILRPAEALALADLLSHLEDRWFDGGLTVDIYQRAEHLALAIMGDGQ